MKKIIQCGAVCALLLVGSSPSFAWGNFSVWTTASPETSTATCSAKRSTGSLRFGLASVYSTYNNGSVQSYAFAQNIMTNGKGEDLWVQTASVRGGPGQMGAHTQGFNITPGNYVFVTVITPIGDTMARCAVQ